MTRKQYLLQLLLYIFRGEITKEGQKTTYFNVLYVLYLMFIFHV